MYREFQICTESREFYRYVIEFQLCTDIFKIYTDSFSYVQRVSAMYREFQICTERFSNVHCTACTTLV